jgi:hypothetical protein
MAFNAQVIRIAVDVSGVQQPLQDLATSAPPQLWNATNIRFELGFFQNAALVDVSGFESVTLQIKDPNNKIGAAFVSRTISSGDLDNSTTDDTWADGTQQQCVVEFDHTETVMPMAGDTTSFWLVLSAVTTGTHMVVLGAGTITFNEAGYEVVGPSSASGDTYYTAQQSDARYMLVSGALDTMNVTTGYSVGNVRVVSAQQAAIPNLASAASGAVISSVNAVLAAMRVHGLIDT